MMKDGDELISTERGVNKVTYRQKLVERLSRLEAGDEFKTFTWYCDIVYRSTQHQLLIKNISESLIANNLIKSYELNDFGVISTPVITQKLLDTLKVDTRVGYDAGCFLPPREINRDLVSEFKDVCEYILNSEIKEEDYGYAYLKKDSSSGYNMFHNTLEEKWPSLKLAFKQMANNFEGCYSRPINIKFLRRQHNSISEKNICDPDTGKLVTAPRAIKSGYKARMRIVQGACPMEAVCGAYLQMVRKFMDKILFNCKRNSSFNDEFFNIRNSFGVTLDATQFESFMTPEINEIFCRMLEKKFPLFRGLWNWKKNTVAIFKSKGKISFRTADKLSQESGSFKTFDQNQAFAIAIHSLTLRKAGLIKNFTDFTNKIWEIFAENEFLVSGDDCCLGFRTSEFRDRYLAACDELGILVKETPSGYLGQKMYGTDMEWYFGYDLDRLIGGLLNREKDSSEFYHLSALSKVSLISRYEEGKKFLKILDEEFKKLFNKTYLDYSKDYMSQEEQDIFNNINKVDSYNNIAFLTNPSSIFYKNDPELVDPSIIDKYYFSVSPDQFEEYLKSFKDYEDKELEEQIRFDFDNFKEYVDLANKHLLKLMIREKTM